MELEPMVSNTEQTKGVLGKESFILQGMWLYEDTSTWGYEIICTKWPGVKGMISGGKEGGITGILYC